jgi:hypothetical protein
MDKKNNKEFVISPTKATSAIFLLDECWSLTTYYYSKVIANFDEKLLERKGNFHGF